MASPRQSPLPPLSASPPPFGQGRDVHAWIEGALKQPFNPIESDSNQSMQQYDNLADVWESTFLAAWDHNGVAKTLFQELLVFLPLGPEAIVLDVGGATGMLARFLVASGLARKVISVDISPSMTEKAHQNFQSLSQSSEKAAGKPVHWELVAICADITIPIENQPELKEHLSDGVDVVISLRTLSNLPSATVTRTLATMRTLLHSGGHIMVDNNLTRPFLHHIVCIPYAYGRSPNHLKLPDVM